MTKVGPHNEGSRLVLECETSGGYPEPTLTWWRDGQLVDDTYEIISQPDGLVVDQLRAEQPQEPVERDQAGGEEPSEEEPEGLGKPLGRTRLIRNRLEVSQLTRNDLLANYSCRAWNSRLGEPPSSSVVIDMNRKYPFRSWAINQ